VSEGPPTRLTPLHIAASSDRPPRHETVLPEQAADALAAARRLGLQVHVWTVNRRPEMIRLLDLGVDGIMTDRADVLR